MQRRDFIKASGLGLGALAIPAWGRAIAAEELVSKLDVGLKKRLADTAMTAARGDGATYCD
ncbi:MAG: twin-arginine translocation signal domain-containing protein, partial [Xanthomonadales bacterium]|nr:twin-arginine translocation signal domain-containing protein [Xanthomonadales bacterium]